MSFLTDEKVLIAVILSTSAFGLLFLAIIAWSCVKCHSNSVRKRKISSLTKSKVSLRSIENLE